MRSEFLLRFFSTKGVVKLGVKFLWNFPRATFSRVWVSEAEKFWVRQGPQSTSADRHLGAQLTFCIFPGVCFKLVPWAPLFGIFQGREIRVPAPFNLLNFATPAEPRGKKNFFCSANFGRWNTFRKVPVKYFNWPERGLTFLGHVSDRFSDLFSRFSNRFSCQIKFVSGTVSFCRRAALKFTLWHEIILRTTPRELLFVMIWGHLHSQSLQERKAFSRNLHVKFVIFSKTFIQNNYFCK